MWILTIYTNADQQSSSEQEQQSYRLVGASEYTIGRKGCMIPLPLDDPSISRHHATIIVSATPALNLNKPTTYFPKVHVIDFSKHGTLINGVNVPPLTKKEAASSGATIIFGRSVVGVLHYAPLICYISKTVHPHIAEQLKVEIGQMCGFVTESEGDYSAAENKLMIAPCWTQGELREAGVSPSSFLFIAEGLVPEKGLMTAMLERYCLVSPAYIPALKRGVKDTPGIPVASLPPPSSAEAPRDEALETLPYRRPEPQLFDALEFSRAAALNPSAMFRTLHFIFIETDVYNLYHEAVERGGGKASFITAYDVMSWYQRNNAAVANQSIASNFSPSRNSQIQNTTSDITPPPADSAFPLRYLLQDRDAHGTNTFIISSKRAFMATLDLIQEGIEEGAVTTKKANRTIVQLPQPTGTIADALALLYLKARLPLVQDRKIMYGLYSEDASSFVAGHHPEKSPTNEHSTDPDTLHFEFTDPSIAASALQVELEEASRTGLLHAPKRNTNYLQSSASRERERKLRHATKRGKIASPSLMMMSALDGNNTSSLTHNNDMGGNSPDSSVSTVDNIRAYQGVASAAAAQSQSRQQSPPTSPLKSALAGTSPTGTPTSKQIRFGGEDTTSTVRPNEQQNDDGLNDDSGLAGLQRNSYSSAGSFSKRQQVVCCQPERLFSHPTLTPKRDRDLVLRRQQEQSQLYSNDEQNNNINNNTEVSGDALYAKWQSFYDSSREGDMVRAQQMYERKQQDGGGSVGRRRAASPALNSLAFASSSSTSQKQGGGANVISVGRSYSPSAAARIQYSHKPIGSPRKNVPFAVSQSSLTRGGSPSKTHKRNVQGDVSLPHSAPFASKALNGRASTPTRSNSPAAGTTGGTPRLLMALNPSNIDHRLLQYCQELETHSLPEVETEVLHANSQHSQGLVYGNLDLLKQRVMRYLVDIDLLLSESKRLGGSIGVRRAASPIPISSNGTRGSSPSARARSPLVAAAGVRSNSPGGGQVNRPTTTFSGLKSPVMKITTNDAHKLAIDCKSRLSVLMTVLEGPEFNNSNQNRSQSQQRLISNNSRIGARGQSPRSASSANNNIYQDSSRKGYYNFDNIDDDRERHELQKIEDALHSPRGSSRVAQERAASQATAQRMMSHPRTSNTPSIPYNTSLLSSKK